MKFNWFIYINFRSVLSGEEARAEFVITPKSSGDRTITAKFSSRELNDVDGYKNIRVSSSFPTLSNNNNNNDINDIND